jgi:DNA-binding transcriptional LysR family regulator
VNVIAGGFDLVIRLGRLDDSELLSRQLERIDMRLVASPDYLRRAGIPRTAADLANHRGILTRADLDHWTIGNQSIRVLWQISTGNMLVTYDAVCAGLGIAMVPGFLADGAIAGGSLVKILPKSRLDQLEVTALQNSRCDGIRGGQSAPEAPLRSTKIRARIESVAPRSMPRLSKLRW